MTAVGMLDEPPQGNISVPTAASRFAHIPELLCCLADNIPKQRSLLFNLCLVSRAFYPVFKPVLWRDMCRGDFFSKGCLNPNSDTENLRYMKTYEDEMDGIHTWNEFHYWGFFSQAPNLELAALETAHEELLQTVRDECPKIRGLYLEMCEHRPEIPPALFDEFSNLTHLVLDGLNIENDGWTWREQAESLASVLIRSPQMRKFGLRDVLMLYVFVLVSEAFAKMNADGTKRLRLRSLLLDRNQFPPSLADRDSADCGRYIEQLTEVRYLEHLHLGGAGLHRPPYDDARFEEAFEEDGEDVGGGGPEELRMIELPSFIGSKSTPNLRRISTHAFNPYVSDWLRNINTSHPEFSNQLSFSCRPRKGDPIRDQLDLGQFPGTMDEFFLSFLDRHSGSKPGVPTTATTDSSVDSFNFRSVVLSLTWSHLPSRNRELYVEQHTPYRQIVTRLQPSPSNPTRDTLREMTIFLVNRDSHVPYPLPERPEQVLADLEDDADRAEYEANISMTKCRHKLEQWTREPLPELYWRGIVTCISSSEALTTVGHTIVRLFDGLKATTIRALHIPLLAALPGNTDWRNYPRDVDLGMPIELFNTTLIGTLSSVENLPELRYVKIFGPAYEIVRDANGDTVQLLRLGRLEEMEIELFRDAWGFGWWC